MTTKRQYGILDHTINRATRGLFCGDCSVMQSLVAAGMMESAGRVSWCPDEYFRITPSGRAAHLEYEDAQPKSPKVPARKKRSRDRYSEYLRHDTMEPFGEWLKKKRYIEA